MSQNHQPKSLRWNSRPIVNLSAHKGEKAEKCELDNAPIGVYISMTSMDAESRKALAIIRECVAADRFRVLPHFRKRMARRGLLWPDILTVLDDPTHVRDDGLDRYDRPKWIVGGNAADGLPVEVVCVLDYDERGDATVFITLYWKD